MRTLHIVLPLCLAVFLLGVPVYGQDAPLSIDPDREVIVMFEPGAVVRPAGVVASRTLDAFTISDAGLSQVLLRADTESIAQVVPRFESEHRFTVSLSGEPVELTDWSNVYLLRVPDEQRRRALLEALQGREDVIYAEANVRGEPDDLPLSPAVRLNALLGLGRGPIAAVSGAELVPNDNLFPQQWALRNEGTSQQGSGTPGADIKANQAWDITTGSSLVKIAVIDDGMQTNHPDFTGRVTGDSGDNSSHGTAVAGVAAAQGNNGQGVAGVAWNVGIINEDYGYSPDATAFANAVRSAYNRGAHVINNSWKIVPTGDYSFTVRLAFADAYRVGSAAVASMGNQAQTSAPETQYPAAFGQGLITVGATTNTDVRAGYSSRGSHIDVAAPGGGGSGAPQADNILTTFPGGTYDFTAGTSFSAPAASGVIALLLSERSDLRPDDLEAILRFSADDLPPAGFDNETGAGRINARRALDMVRSPYVLNRRSATGGAVHASTGTYTWSIVSPQLSGTFVVKRYEVRRTIPVSGYEGTWYAWGLGEGSNATGWSIESPNSGLKYTGVVSQSSSSVTLKSYVYEVWAVGGTYLGYYPTTPQNVRFEYTTLGEPAPLSVSITGPSSVAGGETSTWTANRSGGTPPYSYLWEYEYPCPDPDPCPPGKICAVPDGDITIQAPQCGDWSPTGTSASLTRSFSSSFGSVRLRVRVTDDEGTVRSAQRTISVSSGRPAGDDLAQAASERDGGARSADDQSAAARGAAAFAGTALPSEPELRGAVPNPFHGEAEIAFALPEASEVRLVVFDLLGREVARPVEGRVEAGHHRVRFDGRGLPAGVYVVRMAAGEHVSTARMTLVR